MNEQNSTSENVNVEALMKRVANLEKELNECQSELASEKEGRAKDKEDYQSDLKYWMDKHYEDKKYLATIQNILDIARSKNHF